MLYKPDHPKSQSNGYIYEHILVMEALIGRHLVVGENVHHVNALKDDNRPENLELWLTKQPYGARVEDRVKDALEILKQYLPEALSDSYNK